MPELTVMRIATLLNAANETSEQLDCSGSVLSLICRQSKKKPNNQTTKWLGNARGKMKAMWHKGEVWT